MGQTVRFQEILRRLAIIDEGFVKDQAGLGLGLPASRFMDAKTAALVQVGALVAIGSPGVCLEWSTTRALAAGASEDEVIDVLLAIAPVAGLGRVTGAVPSVAAALGYDVETALLDPDGHWRPPGRPDWLAATLGLGFLADVSFGPRCATWVSCCSRPLPRSCPSCRADS